MHITLRKGRMVQWGNVRILILMLQSKKREMTKQDKLVKDEVMNSYLNQLLSFANKKSKRKLAD